MTSAAPIYIPSDSSESSDAPLTGDIAKKQARFYLHHIVLPPRLPPGQEDDLDDLDRELLCFVHKHAVSYQRQCPSEWQAGWTTIVSLLATWKDVTLPASLRVADLNTAFTNMQGSEVIALHIKAQNAGIIFHHLYDKILVETFEAAPPNKDVINCTGRLQTLYPCGSVIIPSALFSDQRYVKELVFYLSMLHTEHTPFSQSKTTRAGSTVAEERDTADPALVCKMLLAILEASGEAVRPTQIRKNMRDDVCWNKKRISWRRSALWTVLRVTLQLSLSRIFPLDPSPHFQYKSFMVWLISQLCVFTVQSDLSPTGLQAVNAKLARRLAKTGTSIPAFVSKNAMAAMRRSHQHLQSIWEAIQAKDISNDVFNFTKSPTDTVMSLKASQKALMASLGRPPATPQSQEPSLGEFQQLQFEATTKLPPTSIFRASGSARILLQFEAWVADRGLDGISSNIVTCVALSGLLFAYVEAAKNLYQDLPEQVSIMLLTSLEIWMAIDRRVVEAIPLMRHYSPEIPASLLEPLLLPTKLQLQRLESVEQYLQYRHEGANSVNPSHFSKLRASSFPVAYFKDSTELQSVQEAIEKQASATRVEKSEEWAFKKKTYETILEMASKSLHTCEKTKRSKKRCQCCIYMRSAAEVTIKSHEWPLPQDSNELALVIFELCCPPAYSAWRDATFMLVQEIGREELKSGAPCMIFLQGYNPLKPWCGKTKQYITLGSQIKSFLQTHYKSIRFPVLLESVLVNNSLVWTLFNTKLNVWVSKQQGTPRINYLCSLRLNEGPYANLQYSVDSTQHTSNEIIVNQSECSHELSVHEYYAFASLRAGERIQWLNILTELCGDILTFKSKEVCILFCQTIWQAGKPIAESPLRAAHIILNDSQFTTKVLGRLETISEIVKRNWKQEYCVKVLIIVTVRILLLTDCDQRKRQALAILQSLRIATFNWALAAFRKADDSHTDDESLAFQQQILHSAILCRLTFDVDDESLNDILNDCQNLTMLGTCSLMIHDNSPSQWIENAPKTIKQDLYRDYRLTERLAPFLQRRILLDCDGLNNAIKNIWPSYIPYKTWLLNTSRDAQWLKAQTVASQSLYYNPLSGEFLVGGKPFGKLPQEYTSMPDYVRVFGTRIFNVVASDDPVMIYMTTNTAQGYRFYFGMFGSPRTLVIRAISVEKLYEIVQHGTFLPSDIPHAYVYEHIHWLDIATGEVEFRPLSSRFKSSPTNWRLMLHERRLYNLGTELIDPSSSLGLQISKALSGLESATYLHITKDKNGFVQVYLPRFLLTFILTPSLELESLDFGGIVDPDQSFGTFVGLRNRLVICQKAGNHEIPQRSVLVPFGVPKILKTGDHVTVTLDIAENCDQKCRFFRYQVNNVLQELRCPTGDHLGKLFQAYCHAITSFVLPDKLTGRTGTEEALRCLHQPAIQPLQPLNSDFIQLLRDLAELTPQRQFYPRGIRVQQRVIWNPSLSEFSQHDEFHTLVNSIISTSNDLVALHPGSNINELVSCGEPKLLLRAAVRNSSWRKHECGGDLVGNDRLYEGRDSPMSSMSFRAPNTYEVSYLVQAWSFNMALPELMTALNGNIIGSYSSTAFKVVSLTKLLSLSLYDNFGCLYRLCQRATFQEVYQLQFMFGVLAFGSKSPELSILRVLVACAIMEGLEEAPQSRPQYNLTYGWRPSLSAITNVTIFVPIRGVVSNEGVQRLQFAEHLLARWPDRSFIKASVSKFWAGYKLEKGSSDKCNELLEIWDALRPYEIHIKNIDCKLKSSFQKLSNPPSICTFTGFPLLTTTTSSRTIIPSLPLLLQQSVAPFNQPDSPRESFILPRAQTASGIDIKHKIELANAAMRYVDRKANMTEVTYGKDLCESIHCLDRHKPEEMARSIPFKLEEVVHYREQCANHVTDLFVAMQLSCGINSGSHEALKLGGILPTFTPTSLLSLLATSCAPKTNVNDSWRCCLLNYGVALTLLQRADRMVKTMLKGDVAGFVREAQNVGHEGWDPKSYPDWLLMEIEGNFLVRPVQAEVAFRMIKPQGKTSVIMPLIASVLADGKSLARVIVLKPLVKAMADVLSERLGGICGRRIFLTPFSRQTDISLPALRRLFDMWTECRTTRGILLAQPEHLLSFQLIGVERLCADSREVALKLMEMHQHLQTVAKNIVDESDEVMNPREQLIYTIGNQQAFNGGSIRWQTTQDILDLVANHLKPDKAHYCHEGSFPTVHMELDSANMLFDALLHDIRLGRLPGLLLNKRPEVSREAAMRFISQRILSIKDRDEVLTAYHGAELLIILVLRGLIGYGILSHAFMRRHSVDYGLTENRIPKCLVAVPYRAKGCPSRAAEYGHPEVFIVFTCLSYYLCGLNDDQMIICFTMLHKKTDSSLIYSSWTSRCSCIPVELRHLQNVNLDGNADIIFHHLRYNKSVIDFYLANVVFPIHCKEFSNKLSTSAWDIPCCQQTTGFSGTNDTNYLLPLSIVQDDLPELQHTNALVMSYLLRPQNRGYICAQTEGGDRLEAEQLLEVICTRPPKTVRVLIDAGAQVLELTNQAVAETWLRIQPDADAAAYFNEQDEIMVVSRKGRPETLMSSRFQNNLERVLVYLDQSHTRGIDLKFARRACAVVTVGQNLTKDRFVQGCMRMRKLNERQSIIVVAPPEIDRHIRTLAGKTAGQDVNSLDVLKWTIDQTIIGLNESRPLWMVQGLNYENRRMAEDIFLKKGMASAFEDQTQIRNYLRVLREPGAQTLLSMYAYGGNGPNLQNPTKNTTIRKILDTGNSTVMDGYTITSLGEEQEKEVMKEVEIEFQIQRPSKLKALKHRVHEQVLEFVRNNALTLFLRNFDAVVPVWSTLRGTSVEPFCKNMGSTRNLFATKDFMETVSPEHIGVLDEFQRPVRFILSRRVNQALVFLIISPFEANKVLPTVRQSGHVSLHLYSPKITKSMPFLDDFQFYTISRQVETQVPFTIVPKDLNLFTGQLFLRSLSEYHQLLRFLGIPAGKSNGRVTSRSFEAGVLKEEISTEAEQLLSLNRRECLRALLAIRWKGQDASRTHIGRLLAGETLTEKDFEN